MSADFELALLHMPLRARPAMEALLSIDAAMAEVVARSTEPTLGLIKLAWWREQLEALDHNPPPPEPRLKAVAQHLLPVGIKGAELAEVEAGWATLLDALPDPTLVARRGETLFKLGGLLLGADDPKLADAGALYALASAALSNVAQQRLQALRGHRFPRALRPLTMLARAASHRGNPRRSMLAMLAHRWSGKIT